MEMSDQAASSEGGGGSEKLRLKVASGNAAGTVIEVEDELVLGRQAEGAGTLGADIELSRRHARIACDAGGQYFVEDLGSTNGTYVNGRRVDAPLALEVGDRIEVGASALVVQVGAIQPTPASSETVAPTTSSALPREAEIAEAAEASPVADEEPGPVPDPRQPIATPEVEPDVGPAEMGAPEPEPATTAADTPAEVPPFSLRIDVDPVAGRATIALDEGGDTVELLLSDGRWRLA